MELTANTSTTLLAALPLVLVVATMLLLNWSAQRSLFLGLTTVFVSGIFYWHISFTSFAAAAISSFFSTLDIFLIIFGALFLFEAMKSRGKIKQLIVTIEKISSNLKVQALLLAWVLVSFFEGVAGFGTPAAIVAPLLVLFGLSPILSVTLCLLGDSASVIFGAIGTPIIGGYQPLANLMDASSYLDLLQQVSVKSALLNVLFLSFIPTLMMFLLCRWHFKSFANFKKMLPFSLLIGFIFTGIQFFVAYYFGPELPSALAAFITLILFFVGAKIFTLKTSSSNTLTFKEIIIAWWPYGLILILLLLSRLPFFPIKEFFSTQSLTMKEIFSSQVSVSWRPLLNPGLIPFIPVALFFCRPKEFNQVFTLTWQKLYHVIPVLFSGIFMVSIMNLSGAADSDSMILSLASSASQVFGGVWYLMAPFVGVLGSFVSGSATVSNIMFGTFQLSTAKLTGLSPVSNLALQSFGGAIGNMICLHNIVAALAVVGLSGKESEVLRSTLPVTLLLAFFAGLYFWTF